MNWGEFMQMVISRVESRMAERGLRPAQVARLAGLPKDAVYDLLSGKNTDPRLSIAFKISQALGLDIFGADTATSSSSRTASFEELLAEKLAEKMLASGRFSLPAAAALLDEGGEMSIAGTEQDQQLAPVWSQREDIMEDVGSTADDTLGAIAAKKKAPTARRRTGTK